MISYNKYFFYLYSYPYIFRVYTRFPFIIYSVNNISTCELNQILNIKSKFICQVSDIVSYSKISIHWVLNYNGNPMAMQQHSRKRTPSQNNTDGHLRVGHGHIWAQMRLKYLNTTHPNNHWIRFLIGSAPISSMAFGISNNYCNFVLLHGKKIVEYYMRKPLNTESNLLLCVVFTSNVSYLIHLI